MVAMEKPTTPTDEDKTHKLWQLQRALIPSDESFIDKYDQATDFQPVSEKLRNLVDDLINEHKLSARNVQLSVMWKRRGGKVAGQAVWGKTVKLSGLAKHFSGGDEFVIWIAADTLRDARVTNYQLEALLYHELLHIDEIEDSDGNSKAVLVGHQFEGFISEIEKYGAWRTSAKSLEQAFKQAPLVPDGVS